MMLHSEPGTRRWRSLRALPPSLFAALAAYAIMMVFSAPQPWPAIAGAIAGGWLLGRLTRQHSPHK